MKAQDLKIGNLFYPIDRSNEIHLPTHIPFKVYTIELFEVCACLAELNFDEIDSYEVNCYKISDISPIPLTEEWLVRFGFEKRDSSTCVQWWNGINEVTHDWLVDLTWLKEPERIGAPNAPFYRNGKHTIYFVHQLQNLYWCLCGEELTLDK